MTPYILPWLGTIAALLGIATTLPLLRTYPIASLVSIAALTFAGTLALLQLLKLAGGAL